MTASAVTAARGAASPRGALVRRLVADAGVRTLGFALIFAVFSYIQPFGYRRAYPSEAGRAVFATGFAHNVGLRIFYGEPFDIVSIGGYTAWRVGGTLAILAAVFGVLAAVRARRAEEEFGRAEIVLAGLVTRTDAFVAAMAAVSVQAAALFAAEFCGFVAAGLPVGGSAYCALATAAVVPTFAAIGAVASEVAPTRRGALEIGGGAVTVFLLVRVIADTSTAAWLRWASPLGWAEQLRPFTGTRPGALALFGLSTVALAAGAARVAAHRDVGVGVLAARDEAAPRLAMLTSPLAHAWRAERAGLFVWAAAIGGFAFILGVVSRSVASVEVPPSLRREFARLGGGPAITPAAYLAFLFFFFMLAISIFACTHIGAARRDEADGLLETLCALPVGRTRWFAGRGVLAAAGAVALAFVSGMGAWLGAASVGVSVSFAGMIEAGANCVPMALFFLGVAMLAFALVPRASTALSYGLVVTTFLWQAVGSLLSAPAWAVDLTPFAWVGLVPTQGFRALPAAVMAGIGVATALLGALRFRWRDLRSA